MHLRGRNQRDFSRFLEVEDGLLSMIDAEGNCCSERFRAHGYIEYMSISAAIEPCPECMIRLD